MSNPNTTVYSKGPGFSIGVLGEAITEIGHLIAVKPADGLLYKASDDADIRVIGAVVRDNQIGAIGGKVQADCGLFCFENDATNPVTAASLGTVCYVKDSHTVCVAAGSTNKVIAGIVRNIENSGMVAVEVGGADLSAIYAAHE